MRMLFFISPVRKFGGLSFEKNSKTKAIFEIEVENDFELVITDRQLRVDKSCHRLY